MGGDAQRCFTIFHPPTRANEVLPVVLAPNCYANDSLNSIDMKSATTDGNAAATRFGYARIGLSTFYGLNPDWDFGNNGIVNADNPMPCSAEDSIEISYLQTVFDFIDANPEKFDGSRIYAAGFSQNSMFSAYIGFCFNDRVLGIWQGGSGMALTGEEPFVPNCGAQVAASDMAQCDADGIKCRDCYEIKPC